MPRVYVVLECSNKPDKRKKVSYSPERIHGIYDTYVGAYRKSLRVWDSLEKNSYCTILQFTIKGDPNVCAYEKRDL